MASRWNKLPRTLWTDGVMATLDPVPLTETTLYLYMMTCDRPTRIAGLLRGPVSIAEDTGWDLKGVRKGVRMLHAKGHLMVSERPFYILVPEALAFDLPGNGKETKGALMTLAELPQVGPVVAAASIIQAREWVRPEKGDAMPLPMGHADGHRKPESREQRAESSTQGSILVASEPRPADPVAQVWEHYLSRRKVRRDINDTARRLIKALLRSKRTVEQICLVVDWSHDAQTSAHLRTNDNGTDYTRWATVFAKANFDKYIDEAEPWKAGGSVKAPAGRPEGGSADYVKWMHVFSGRCWDDVGRLFQSGRWKRATLRESLEAGGFDRMIREDEPPCPDPQRAIKWLCLKAGVERAV